MTALWGCCRAAVQGEDYVLGGPADQLLLDSAARGLKRKTSIQVSISITVSILSATLSLQ